MGEEYAGENEEISRGEREYVEWGSMQSRGRSMQQRGGVCRRGGVCKGELSIKVTLAVPVKSAGGFQDNFTEVLPSLPLWVTAS